jgi:hypothetical protein
MPRTRKELFKQNLDKIPVLVKDTAQESVYFNIKQLNSYFTGGRNAFLITGTTLLEPNTNIFIELLDVNGKSMYVEAIKNFAEGGARVIVVEVYENSARGAAILTIVGTARQLANGNPIPSDWKGRSNVSWQKKIIIEPKNQNITPIRLKVQPQIITNELLLTGSLLSQSIINQAVSNIVLKPKSVLNKQRGYIVVNDCNTFQFRSFHLTPKITGSVTLQKRKYLGTIPATTESYTVLENHTASLNLPLSHLNASKSFTDINITSSTDGNILNIPTLNNGQYELGESLYTASNTTYVRTASSITGSINYYYVSESVRILPTNIRSFAKLRLINLDTVSGQIFRIKASSREAAIVTDFEFIADTPTVVGELLITSSTGLANREQPIGVFSTNQIISSSWYGYRMTGSAIPDPSYYDDAVSSSYQFTLPRDDSHMLDAVYALTTASNYFIGTRQEFGLFPTSEYTLKLDSFVYTTSQSAAFTASNYNVDIYLTGSAVIGRDKLGQKIGSISTTEKVAYFPQKTFNFRIAQSGSAGLRFVVSNGFWQFANVSLKVAEEYAFSPDEVTITIPNNSQITSSLVFKTELFDLNNNALNLDIISTPTFFSGSQL